MRDGRVVHVGPIAELDRLHLIAAMLGRDVAEVSRHGTTAFEQTDVQDGEPVLRAHGLSRRHELDGVSVEIHKGEVVGLGGLLGSGRSETAKAIAGALPLDSGEVEVAGRPLRGSGTARAIRAGVVMLPEDRKVEGILPELSVRENIVLAARPRLSRMGLVSRAREDEVVRFFTERLRIKAASPDQPVSQLSGGNQQKVMLARWLCLHPKVLLLDEPTRGIDVGAKAEVQSLINELARDGLGVLLISSELEELIEGSDRIVALKDGAVVGELSGSQVSEAELMRTLAASPTTADPRTAEEQPEG
jgi:ribose transport system ATP-binding protein